MCVKLNVASCCLTTYLKLVYRKIEHISYKKKK